jgi:hypothetical protein
MPGFMASVVKMLFNKRIQTLDQIVANTGFSKEWVQRLLSLPSGGSELQPTIVEFKRRA